jgi:hypothetical protein
VNRRQIIERESRWQQLAGWAAVAGSGLFVASIVIQQSAAVPIGGLRTERFRAVDEASGQLLTAAIISSVAFLLITIPLLYLFRAAEARSERVSGPMIGFVFIGPALLAVQAIIGSLAQAQVASDFVAMAPNGGDIYTMLDDLIDDNSLSQFAASLYIPAGLGFVVAMVYIPLQAMRTGLLTRFFATLGMALGVSTVILPPGVLGVMIWFGWLGFTILDRVPKGRPPAWAAGEAIPWPRPGEEPQVATAPAGVVDGDATEVFPEPQPQDHSARRERARKRKRKRRR